MDGLREEVEPRGEVINQRLYMRTIDCLLECERQKFLEKQKSEDLAIEAAFIAALEEAENVSMALTRVPFQQ